jgi:hypothetical protein
MNAVGFLSCLLSLANLASCAQLLSKTFYLGLLLVRSCEAKPSISPSLLIVTLSISCLLRISKEGEIEGWLRTRSKQEIERVTISCLFIYACFFAP